MTEVERRRERGGGGTGELGNWGTGELGNWGTGELGCSSLPDRTEYSLKPDVTPLHSLERTLRHEQLTCNNFNTKSELPHSGQKRER
jgi:hypothetical protein